MGINKLSLAISQRARSELMSTLLYDADAALKLPDEFRAYVDTLKTWRRAEIDLVDALVDSIRDATVASRHAIAFKSDLQKADQEAFQLSSAIEEMSATAAEIAAQATLAQDAATESAHLSNEGNEALASLIGSLMQAESAISEMGYKVADFIERTRQISNLTQTVNSIAEQTNLLALNAAIEAARAGEQGRGFAVVADEVRGLAQRSGTAAAEIKQIVGGVVAEADGVAHTVTNTLTLLDESSSFQERVATVLSDAHAAAERASESVVQIATAAEEQSSVAVDMSSQIHDISARLRTLTTAFEGVTTGLEDARRHGLTALSVANTWKSPDMVLTLSKSDHVVWVDKLVRYAVFSESSINEEEIKDHHQCRLGKWLDTEGQKYANLPGFKDLYDRIHPEVHRIGREIWSEARNGKPASINAKVESLIAASSQVIDSLESLRGQIRN